MTDAATDLYYRENASAFIDATENADMKQHCEKFLALLPEKASVLDAGCGSGRDALFFAEKGCRVTAVDASPELCLAAQEKLGGRALVLNLSFDALPFSDSFDGIWACASLLHLPLSELPAAMQKLQNALKTGGVLYASWKYGDTERRDAAGRFYCDMNKERIVRILESVPGFSSPEIRISEDVRPGCSVKWLNMLVKKTL